MCATTPYRRPAKLPAGTSRQNAIVVRLHPLEKFEQIAIRGQQQQHGCVLLPV
ncbi:MAG: hypothetical protein RQ982_03945 [Gammaproteobacteria bacterium]|nr:hypothetical protein [Gammaproteobacteria bacterium]